MNKALISLLFGVLFFLATSTEVLAYAVNCTGGGTLTIDKLDESDKETIKKIQESPLCIQNKDPFICKYEPSKVVNTKCRKDASNDNVTVCEGNSEGSPYCRQEQGITICRENTHIDYCQVAKWEMQKRVLDAVNNAIPTLTLTPTVIIQKIKALEKNSPTLAPEPTPIPTIATDTLPPISQNIVKDKKIGIFQKIISFLLNLVKQT